MAEPSGTLDWSRQVVVIAGASGGIGAAVAERVAALGGGVVLAARREAELRALAARCGARALPVVADMTDRGEVRRVVAAALQHFGDIDIWVNNVGQGITRPPSQLTDLDIEAMIRVNVLSALYGMQEVLPHFQARGRGHVITISSMLGRVPERIPRAAYNGAKHFLNALTANFRAEVQATHPGIAVSLVSPGAVRTEFGRNAMHGGVLSGALPGVQDVGEVAEVIVAVMQSRRPDVYTRAGSQEQVMRYFATLGDDP